MSLGLRKRLLVAVLSAIGLLQAQDSDDQARDRQQTAVESSPGARLFKQTCGFCHGPDARGASGPDLIRSSLVIHDEDGNLIGPVVRNGRPEKGMPAFQLSDAQIRDIAGFLHAEAKIASSVAKDKGEAYPAAKLLVGDAQAGRAYFNGAGKCAGCHSAAGDLAHVAAKYKPVELQARIAYPAGAKPSVTVTDEHGKKFKGEQVYADEFTVALRDQGDWIRSWVRNRVQVEIRDPLAAHQALLPEYTPKKMHDVFAYLESLK